MPHPLPELATQPEKNMSSVLLVIFLISYCCVFRRASWCVHTLKLVELIFSAIFSRFPRLPLENKEKKKNRLFFTFKCSRQHLYCYIDCK
jgi:hypothetical protein